MASVPATVAALLDAARHTMAQHPLDMEELLMLLANMPTDDLDVQTRGAVQHARLVATAGRNGKSSHTAVARFALARVIVLLEHYLPVAGQVTPEP